MCPRVPTSITWTKALVEDANFREIQHSKDDGSKYLVYEGTGTSITGTGRSPLRGSVAGAGNYVKGELLENTGDNKLLHETPSVGLPAKEPAPINIAPGHTVGTNADELMPGNEPSVIPADPRNEKLSGGAFDKQSFRKAFEEVRDNFGNSGLLAKGFAPVNNAPGQSVDVSVDQFLLDAAGNDFVGSGRLVEPSSVREPDYTPQNGDRIVVAGKPKNKMSDVDVDKQSLYEDQGGVRDVSGEPDLPAKGPPPSSISPGRSFGDNVGHFLSGGNLGDAS